MIIDLYRYNPIYIYIYMRLDDYRSSLHFFSQGFLGCKLPDQTHLADVAVPDLDPLAGCL